MITAIVFSGFTCFTRTTSLNILKVSADVVLSSFDGSGTRGSKRLHCSMEHRGKSFMTTTHPACWGVWRQRPDKSMNPHGEGYVKPSQIKTTARYHYTSIRVAKIQNTDNTKCWRGCGATGTPIHCWWEFRMAQPLWKRVCWFLTKPNILLPYDPAIVHFGIYPKELKT